MTDQADALLVKINAAVKAAKTTVHGEGIRAWAPVGVSGIPATVAITVTGTALGPIEIEG